MGQIKRYMQELAEEHDNYTYCDIDCPCNEVSLRADLMREHLAETEVKLMSEEVKSDLLITLLVAEYMANPEELTDHYVKRFGIHPHKAINQYCDDILELNK